MKRLLYILLVFLTIAASAMGQKVVVSSGDKVRVVRMLAEATKQPKTTNWMIYFGKQFLGQPYVGGTLDKGQEEKLVVNLAEVDCTTYIEYLVALTKCAERGQTSFDDFCEWLKKIRYIDGDVDYCKRQHYFNIWMEDNEKEGLIEVPQPPKGESRNTNNRLQTPLFTGVQKKQINWMTTHSQNYKMLTAHPEWKNGIRQLELSISDKPVRYIPKALLKPTEANNKLLRQYIKDGDIIVLMTNKKGLDTAHITMAKWRKDGLHVMHASSLYKKVVDDDKTLYDYMRTKDTLTGIRICRVL